MTVQTYADKHAPALYYTDDEPTGESCPNRPPIITHMDASLKPPHGDFE